MQLNGAAPSGFRHADRRMRRLRALARRPPAVGRGVVATASTPPVEAILFDMVTIAEI